MREQTDKSAPTPRDPAPDFLDGIAGGIEWFTWEGIESGACARRGSSCAYAACSNCGGEGYSHHSCGEDCCMCISPEDNVICDYCLGSLGSYHCVSGPEWCEANPLPGREHIRSTALTAEAWSDA